MREEEAKALLLKVETLFLTHKANTKVTDKPDCNIYLPTLQ